MQRLDKNRKESLLNHAKIQVKPKKVQAKPPPVKEPEVTYLRDPKAYAKIMELPIYEPTTEEFKQPFLLIRRLYELGYEKYGCVKIRTPKSWNPKFSFDNDDKKLTTRKQNLKDLMKGKVCYKVNF